MKQVTGLTSTYSSDTFGVCSALYELGGMVVMHDASGCNSTYTTHDEPRWYSMESMIYISALSEKEAVMGDDEKLIRDVTETALKLRPKFIALAGAPIPFMTGTDFNAIAALIERRTGIPAFGFDTNGMQGYLTGISMALAAVVKRFCRRNEEEAGRDTPRESAEDPSAGSLKNLPGCKSDKDKKIMVNIIGATPLDFSLNGSVESMEEWLAESGFTAGACLAMGSSLEDISSAGEADVNLVVSYGGLAAARELEMRFGTPWIAGVPVGKVFAAELAEKVMEAAQKKLSGAGYIKGPEENSPFGARCAGFPGEGNAEDAKGSTPFGARCAGSRGEGNTEGVKGNTPFGARCAASPGEGYMKDPEENSRGKSMSDYGQSASVQSSDKGSEVTEKVSSGESEYRREEAAFVGESIFGGSLARAVELETGRPVRVLCPVETEDRFLRNGDLRTPEEDDLMRELSAASVVIADPLYQRICPPEADFYPLRHVAFSGRLFEETDFNLINRKIVK